MKHEKKAQEIYNITYKQCIEDDYPEIVSKTCAIMSKTGAEIMAEWKEQQMLELWNVARNVYEAWMGGTMNDVRECMQDLGHVYDQFKDRGIY